MPSDIVDLSHELDLSTPAYPGDPVVFTCSTVCTIEKDACRVAAFGLGTHTGTHIDAPAHFIANGAAVDALDLSTLVGRMVLLDLRALVAGRARHRISWAALAPWHARIADAGRSGGILVLRTGWSAHWKDAAGAPYAAHPFLARDAAAGIAAAGVRALAVDTFSPDETLGDPPTDFCAHHALLGAGCAIAENVRLEGLDGVWREDERDAWRISLLPLRLTGLDGSPVRAVAWKGGADSLDG
ncbi:putative cyclase [Auricularia subglabra TFB-10046 SS5]|nr:putative cyclase [Auricularia subglabra TFB-10046 SS5]